jgi:perosamine synthetase
MEREVVEAVRSVIGDAPAEMHEPYLPLSTIRYINECVESGKLSAGKKVKQFEEMVCEISGAKYAVATCNGTCALYAALKCLGLSGTIKIPSLTFVATANAVVQTGMTPHFTEHKDAELPVDLLGAISPAKGAVRDSCQAFGTKGITGTRVYSFNQNKIVTTSLGGAVVTDDEALAREIAHRITTARIPHPYLVEHDNTGWNYRMADVNAAIGIAQLEWFEVIVEAKQILADRYKEAFDKIGIKMMPTGNNWLNTILVPPDRQIAIIEALHNAGYKARMLPTPLHSLKPYVYCGNDDLTKSMDIWHQAISLPSSPKLGMKHL